jgi:hypothetical protein
MKKDSFYQASQPDGEHLSKIRLLEELARQKGTPDRNSFKYHLNDTNIIIYLDEKNNSVYAVNRYGHLLCSKNVPGEDHCFFGGPWFDEVEKHRSEIEGNLKQIEEERIEKLVDGSFKVPESVKI